VWAEVLPVSAELQRGEVVYASDHIAHGVPSLPPSTCRSATPRCTSAGCRSSLTSSPNYVRSRLALSSSVASLQPAGRRRLWSGVR
jgi:hypothetical protein